MKIYTKKGDTGTTQLIGGTRIPKHHLRIESYGTVDELNSFVGLLRDQAIDKDYKMQLIEIPKGDIELRDDRTNEKWNVKIDTFLLGKFPVTQKFYEEIMKQNPSEFKGENLPVENVSWIDAVSFCNSLSELQNLAKSFLLPGCV